MDDWRTVRVMPRAEMLKRVARFKELKGSDKGLPDSHLPESHKTLYAVIGFAPPEEKLNEATFSPVGDASAIPAIPIALMLPFVPESQVWLERRRAGTLQRPSILELFSPQLRRVALVTAGWPAETASAHAAGQTFTSIPIATNTGEKPQSKVWRYAGTWWTVLPSTAVSPTGTWLWRLNPDRTWTNVLHLSDREDTKADTKRVGNVTHVLLHGAAPELVSIQYDAVQHRYVPWPGRSAATPVSLPRSETATIDIDSTGRMWLGTDGRTEVDVYYSDFPYASFTGPITLEPSIKKDDIVLVTALPDNTIGVLSLTRMPLGLTNSAPTSCTTMS